MIQENAERNRRVYELWTKGLTINEIATETAIPRSTVGYYVRKFNNRAKSGEPIVFQQIEKKPDEKEMADLAYIKTSMHFGLLEMAKNQEIDKLYKLLMIFKLWKELRPSISLTKEEVEAFYKNLST